MKIGSPRITIAVAWILFFSCPAILAFNFEEDVGGDLDNFRLTPTLLVTNVGSNTLTATTGGIDSLEYITFTVLAGQQLEAIILDSYISANDRSFMAVQSGLEFTEPPREANVENLLGWVHFGTSPIDYVGTDILDDMGVGLGAIGFTPPLPSA